MNHPYNVRHLPWVPVQYLDGRSAVVGLDELFTHAHLIADLRTGDAASRIALLRFLPSVLALILRNAPSGGARHALTPALPPEYVTSTLDALDAHLWLEHPESPFMQDAAINQAKSASMPARWLNLFAPTDSGKGWECADNDPHYDGSLSPAEAALYLVTAWFLAPPLQGTSSGYYHGDTTRYRGRGSISGAGLRAFGVGATLLETLAVNTPGAWVDAGQPSWLDRTQKPGASALGDATWSGTTFLLTAADGRYTRVSVAGRRVEGLDTPASVERSLWLADPSMLHRDARGKDGTTNPADKYRLQPAPPGAAGLQHIQELFAITARSQAVTKSAAGLIPASRYQIASVKVEGSKAPNVTDVHWLNLPESIFNDDQRGLLLAIANTIAAPCSKLLWSAITAGLGREFGKSLAPAAQADFAWRAEPHLARLLAEHNPDEAFTPEELAPFNDALLAAFDSATMPYRTPRTLAGTAGTIGLARARRNLTRELVKR